MYYEINISKKGIGHYFATAERSIQDNETAQRIANELATFYTKEKGFEIKISRWQKCGEYIEFVQASAKPVIKTMGEIEAENPDEFKND